MSEESRRILDLLAAGKITAADAEKLLNAVSERQSRTQGTPLKPKYLIVNVDSNQDGGEKVNIRIPLQVLRAGVKLASVMPALAKTKMNEALHEKGLDFDLDKVRPEDIEGLIEALGEMTVDVDDHEQKVRIHCE